MRQILFGSKRVVIVVPPTAICVLVFAAIIGTGCTEPQDLHSSRIVEARVFQSRQRPEIAESGVLKDQDILLVFQRCLGTQELHTAKDTFSPPSMPLRLRIKTSEGKQVDLLFQEYRWGICRRRLPRRFFAVADGDLGSRLHAILAAVSVGQNTRARQLKEQLREYVSRQRKVGGPAD